MKTFNDLKPGNYIYELDVVSCNVECIKVKDCFHAFEESKVLCLENIAPFYVNKNNSFINILDVIYYCDKEECLDKLSKLIKHHQATYKNAKQNIQKLREL